MPSPLFPTLGCPSGHSSARPFLCLLLPPGAAEPPCARASCDRQSGRRSSGRCCDTSTGDRLDRVSSRPVVTWSLLWLQRRLPQWAAKSSDCGVREGEVSHEQWEMFGARQPLASLRKGSLGKALLLSVAQNDSFSRGQEPATFVPDTGAAAQTTRSVCPGQVLSTKFNEAITVAFPGDRNQPGIIPLE